MVMKQKMNMYMVDSVFIRCCIRVRFLKILYLRIQYLNISKNIISTFFFHVDYVYELFKVIK